MSYKRMTVSVSSSISVVLFIYSLSVIRESNYFPHVFSNPYIPLSFLFFLAVLLVSHASRKSTNDSTFLTLFYLFVFVSFISMFVSNVPYLVFQRVILILLPSYVVYYIVSRFSNTIEAFDRVSSLISVSGITLSLYAVAIYLSGSIHSSDGYSIASLNIFGVELQQRVDGYWPLLRLSSLTVNPNTLGIILALSISFTVVRPVFRAPTIHAASLIIQIISLLLTFSRGGLLTLIIILAMQACLDVGNQFRVRKQCVLLLTLLTSVIILGYHIQSNSMEASNRVSDSLSGRDTAWTPLVQSFWEHPWIGVGFGTSYESILEDRNLVIAAHSAHLALLSEVGIVGYLLFISMIGYSVTRLLPFILCKFQTGRVQVLMSGALIVGIFFNQFFELMIFRNSFLNTLLFILLAIINGTHSDNKLVQRDDLNWEAGRAEIREIN